MAGQARWHIEKVIIRGIEQFRLTGTPWKNLRPDEKAAAEKALMKKGLQGERTLIWAKASG